MFPLGDENPRSIVPVVTWGLIAVNVLVFVWEIFTPLSLIRIVDNYGFIPTVGINYRLLTSMFLHADFLHIAGNMLYLWIFGDNVEDACGHFSFALFYLLAGIGGSLTMLLIDPTSNVPAIGASGAISGLLGGYILLFPNARIRTVVFAFYFAHFLRVPAYVLLGFWFLLQFLYGVIGVTTGVAYWAHIGGFVTGLLLIYIFARRRRHRNR